MDRKGIVMADLNFNDRMYMEGEAVYASIERGDYSSPQQVEAALMDGHVRASGDDEHK